LSAEDVQANLELGRNCHSDKGSSVIGGRATGAVRISFGYMTRIEEIDKFVQFLFDEFRDCTASGERMQLPADIQSAMKAAVTPITPISASCEPADYQVHSIYIYPVKSCGGQNVDSWPLGQSGFLYGILP